MGLQFGTVNIREDEHENVDPQEYVNQNFSQAEKEVSAQPATYPKSRPLIRGV